MDVRRRAPQIGLRQMRPNRRLFIGVIVVLALVLLAAGTVLRSRDDSSRHDAVLGRVDECGMWKVRLGDSLAGDLWEADPQPEPARSDPPAPQVITGGASTTTPSPLVQRQAGSIPGTGGHASNRASAVC